MSRKYEVVKTKMNDLYNTCGVSSFFVLCSEVPFKEAQLHSFTAPSGTTCRPKIPQQTINSIGKTLQDSLRHHEANVDYYDPNLMLQISKNDSINIIKR